MEKYLLFAYESYEAQGGIKDLNGTYPNIHAAKMACGLRPWKYMNFQVVRLADNNLTIVSQGNIIEGNDEIAWEDREIALPTGLPEPLCTCELCS